MSLRQHTTSLVKQPAASLRGANGRANARPLRRRFHAASKAWVASSLTLLAKTKGRGLRLITNGWDDRIIRWSLSSGSPKARPDGG